VDSLRCRLLTPAL